jgi:hypothetical protein
MAVTNDKFMASRKDSPYWKDVQTFMLVRQVASNIYNSFPSGDKRKSAFLDNYLAAIQNFSMNVHPELRQIISNYFDNDNLKAVS